jgi:hypothetical protein
VVADVAKASADELRAAWGPFVAEGGTYEVAGNLITMRPIASKNPAVMGPGVFITYSYKLEGDTLSLTQQRNQNGPFANPFSFKAVRVIITDGDLDPDIEGVQNVWIQGVGCGTGSANFN